MILCLKILEWLGLIFVIQFFILIGFILACAKDVRDDDIYKDELKKHQDNVE